MAINTELYVNNNNQWQYKDKNSVTSVSSNKQNHSERALYNNFISSTRNPFLIVQDAFPCQDCHGFFRNATNGNGRGIIFKITANNGNYSADHGLGLNGSTPRIIYYFNGASKMVSMSSTGTAADPPANFPVHPDFDHF